MPISAKDGVARVGVSLGALGKIDLTETRSWTYLSETLPNFEAFLGSPGLRLDSNSSHFLIGYSLLTHLPASSLLCTLRSALRSDLIPL